MFYKDERVAVFIDGPSLYQTSRSLGFEVDYKKLQHEFLSRGKLIRVLYYAVLLESCEQSPIRPLLDWLSYNGYKVVIRVAKKYTNSHGCVKVSGNIGVELAVNALALAPYIDHAVIFSGDSGLCPLVESLKRQAVRVSVVSSIRTEESAVDDQLRRRADNFIELDDLRSLVGIALKTVRNAS